MDGCCWPVSAVEFDSKQLFEIACKENDAKARLRAIGQEALWSDAVKPCSAKNPPSLCMPGSRIAYVYRSALTASLSCLVPLVVGASEAETSLARCPQEIITHAPTELSAHTNGLARRGALNRIDSVARGVELSVLSIKVKQGAGRSAELAPIDIDVQFSGSYKSMRSWLRELHGQCPGVVLLSLTARRRSSDQLAPSPANLEGRAVFRYFERSI